MLFRFPRQRVRNRTFRVEAVDDRGQVCQYPFAQFLRAFKPLLQRQVGPADAFFQRVQFALTFLRPLSRFGFSIQTDLFRVRDFIKIRQLGCVDGLDAGRVAEVEQGAFGHIGIVQHTVQDFQLGHRMIFEFRQPGFLRDDVRVNLLGDPAVALAQQADEVGAAAHDFRQADRQDLTLVGLFFGDAPAQVHLAPGHGALVAQFAQLREYELDEVVTFRLHIAESGGDEHTNLSGLCCCHDRDPPDEPHRAGADKIAYYLKYTHRHE